MAKIMDPILPILSILGYWAIIFGSFGGPGLVIGPNTTPTLNNDQRRLNEGSPRLM